MLVGWQLASHMRSDLVVDALEMAVGLRRPPAAWSRTRTGAASTRACTTPTDWTSTRSRRRSAVEETPYDNAMVEAWVATYKSELVQGRLLSFEHLEHETLTWIAVTTMTASRRTQRRASQRIEAFMTRSPARPFGPPEASRPALHEGAPTGRETPWPTASKTNARLREGAASRQSTVTRTFPVTL
jgi:hypothetical protein